MSEPVPEAAGASPGEDAPEAAGGNDEQQGDAADKGAETQEIEAETTAHVDEPEAEAAAGANDAAAAEPEATPAAAEPETTPAAAEPEATPAAAEPEATPATSEPEATPAAAEPEATPAAAEPEATPAAAEPEATPAAAEPEATPAAAAGAEGEGDGSAPAEKEPSAKDSDATPDAVATSGDAPASPAGTPEATADVEAEAESGDPATGVPKSDGDGNAAVIDEDLKAGAGTAAASDGDQASAGGADAESASLDQGDDPLEDDVLGDSELEQSFASLRDELRELISAAEGGRKDAVSASAEKVANFESSYLKAVDSVRDAVKSEESRQKVVAAARAESQKRVLDVVAQCKAALNAASRPASGRDSRPNSSAGRAVTPVEMLEQCRQHIEDLRLQFHRIRPSGLILVLLELQGLVNSYEPKKRSVVADKTGILGVLLADTGSQRFAEDAAVFSVIPTLLSTGEEYSELQKLASAGLESLAAGTAVLSVNELLLWHTEVLSGKKNGSEGLGLIRGAVSRIKDLFPSRPECEVMQKHHDSQAEGVGRAGDQAKDDDAFQKSCAELELVALQLVPIRHALQILADHQSKSVRAISESNPFLVRSRNEAVRQFAASAGERLSVFGEAAAALTDKVLNQDSAAKNDALDAIEQLALATLSDVVEKLRVAAANNPRQRGLENLLDELRCSTIALDAGNPVRALAERLALLAPGLRALEVDQDDDLSVTDENYFLLTDDGEGEVEPEIGGAFLEEDKAVVDALLGTVTLSSGATLTDPYEEKSDFGDSALQDAAVSSSSALKELGFFAPEKVVMRRHVQDLEEAARRILDNVEPSQTDFEQMLEVSGSLAGLVEDEELVEMLKSIASSGSSESRAPKDSSEASEAEQPVEASPESAAENPEDKSDADAKPDSPEDKSDATSAKPDEPEAATTAARSSGDALGEDGAQYPWEKVPDLWKDDEKANFDSSKLESVFPGGKQSASERTALWKELDFNGNGYVSLAEFDSWFNKKTIAFENANKDAPAGTEGSDKSELFRYSRPSLIRAFNLANGVAKVDPESKGIAASGDDFVTKPEFRLLLVALQSALRIFRLFDIADTSDDRRISKEEWTSQLGVINAELSAQGYSGEAMAADDFDQVDADGGGVILLDEAVSFFLKAFTTEKSLLEENEAEQRSAPANGSNESTSQADSVVPLLDLASLARDLAAMLQDAEAHLASVVTTAEEVNARVLALISGLGWDYDGARTEVESLAVSLPKIKAAVQGVRADGAVGAFERGLDAFEVLERAVAYEVRCVQELGSEDSEDSEAVALAVEANRWVALLLTRLVNRTDIVDSQLTAISELIADADQKDSNSIDELGEAALAGCLSSNVGLVLRQFGATKEVRDILQDGPAFAFELNVDEAEDATGDRKTVLTARRSNCRRYIRFRTLEVRSRFLQALTDMHSSRTALIRRVVKRTQVQLQECRSGLRVASTVRGADRHAKIAHYQELRAAVVRQLLWLSGLGRPSNVAESAAYKLWTEAREALRRSQRDVPATPATLPPLKEQPSKGRQNGKAKRSARARRGSEPQSKQVRTPRVPGPEILTEEHMRKVFRAKCLDIGIPATPLREDRFVQNMTMMCSGNTFDLREAGVGENAMRVIARSLADNTQFTSLNLAGNRLRNIGAEILARGLLQYNDVLTGLDLRSNDISSDGSVTLFETLAMPDSPIKELDLSGISGINRNHIGKAGAIALNSLLRFTKNLEILRLCENGLGAAGAEIISSALADNRTLRELDLGANNLGTDGTNLLLRSLTGSNVRILKLARNGIGDGAADSLSQLILVQGKIEELDCSGNNVGGHGARFLAEAVRDTICLKSLNLKNNQLAGMGARHLASSLKENNTITWLNLDNNDIPGPAGVAIAEALPGNSVLQTLHLSDNDLRDEGATALALSLKWHKSLIYVHIAGNRIGNQGGAELAQMLESNSTLHQLDVRNNSFTDIAGERFAQAVKSNRTLLELAVAFNDFNYRHIEAMDKAMMANRKQYRADALTRAQAEVEVLKRSEIKLVQTEQKIREKEAEKNAALQVLASKKKEVADEASEEEARLDVVRDAIAAQKAIIKDLVSQNQSFASEIAAVRTKKEEQYWNLVQKLHKSKDDILRLEKRLKAKAEALSDAETKATTEREALEEQLKRRIADRDEAKKITDGLEGELSKKKKLLGIEDEAEAEPLTPKQSAKKSTPKKGAARPKK